MLRRWLVLLVVAVAGSLVASAGQADKKAPIPSQDAQARAHKLIRELYGAEIKKADDDSAARARLALTFLQEARDTSDDPAGRFVLLDLAIRYAAQANDSATSLQAIEE